MIVFIAGATGAVGRPLVRQLASAGHEVIGQLDRRRSSDTSVPPVLQASSSTPATAMLYDARSSQHRRMSSSTSSPTWHNRCDPADSATG